MIELLKHGSWILATLIFIIFNITFNKGKPSSGWGHDMMPLIRGCISVVLYMAFWIIWLTLTLPQLKQVAFFSYAQANASR